MTRPATQPVDTDDTPYLADGDDDLDESSDPFEILAAREEAAGVPLFFMTTNQEAH